jgi:transcriptional regulator with XRE-family HTH domain
MTMYPRLKELRKEKKLTQLQVSMALEMEQTHYSRYERGAREPTIRTMIKFARYFNTSIDYIVGETDNRNAYQ